MNSNFSRYFSKQSAVVFLYFFGLAFFNVATLSAIQFIPLGPGHIARDVSGDGTTVVGDASQSGFRWSLSKGFEFLPVLRTANAVSRDGTIVAGTVPIPGTIIGLAALWTENGGAQPISSLPNLYLSVVRNMSRSGQVVVGYAYPNVGPPKAFRWDTINGMEAISVDLSGFDSANAVSDDGQTVVGIDGGSAFRWTRSEGLKPLTGLVGQSIAYGVSADGTVVVGSVRGEAFRWTQAGGKQGLDDFLGGDFASSALDVTPDGSTIVGQGSTDRGVEAFIWTQDSGMRNLNEILIQNGINLNGWLLQSARGISDNGQVIVGGGINPEGRSEAWVIIIPEPTSLLLFSIAAVMLGVSRFRTRRG